jgi:pyruvate kinase
LRGSPGTAASFDFRGMAAIITSMHGTTRRRLRATKIIATLGPATEDPEVLRELIESGMNVARINASHGDHEGHARTIAAVRKIARETGRPVGILLDLQGPKIRLGPLPSPRELAPGEIFNIAVGRPPGDDELSSDYDMLDRDVAVGDPLLIDDGQISCEVVEAQIGTVTCRVNHGGTVHPRKGINLPRSSVSAPAITEKDRADALFAVKQGVDYIALSFVRRARDVLQLGRILDEAGSSIPIISKIEKPQALVELQEILRASWGVMVARGDLGVELPPEQVPVVQKRIIQEAVRAGRRVITATQMLDSMTRNPKPTRAEASDVANAVLDGTDAVMLSNETAMGQFPVHAVRMMRDIIEYTENHSVRPTEAGEGHSVDSMSEAVADAGCLVAHNLGAQSIVAFTQSGHTALLASRRRPGLPILAFTTSEEVRDRLTLVWGVRPYCMEPAQSTDDLIEALDATIQADDLARRGDPLVLLMGAPTHRMGLTNLMLVYRVGSWAPLEGE